MTGKAYIIFIQLLLRYFKMDRTHRIIAQYVWQAREELGLEGSPTSDWEFAERCLCECGNHPIYYDIVYDWLKDNYYEENNGNERR